MGRPSLPHRARFLVGFLVLSGPAASLGLQPVALAQEAMVQWRQQIQNSFGSGSIPSPAAYGPLAPVTVPAAPATPETPPQSTPQAPRQSTEARATGTASSPPPPVADGTCPPLRLSQLARIQAGRPVRLRGGNCLMEFN